MTEPGRAGYQAVIDSGAVLPRQPTVRQERTMSVVAQSVVPQVLTDLDRRIAAAYRELGVARQRFGDAPSGEGLTVCEAAEETVNDLLDQRCLLTQQRAHASAA
jgi:hypothetical protein